MMHVQVGREDLVEEVVSMFGSVDVEAFASAYRKWTPEQRSFCSLYLDEFEARKGQVLARWKQRRESK